MVKLGINIYTARLSNALPQSAEYALAGNDRNASPFYSGLVQSDRMPVIKADLTDMVPPAYKPAALLAIAGAVAFLIVADVNRGLFHETVGHAAMIIAASTWLVTWYTHRLARNGYLTALGSGYLWVAVLEFVHLEICSPATWHTPEADRAWLAGRLFEAVVLLAAPAFAGRKPGRLALLAGFGLLAGALGYCAAGPPLVFGSFRFDGLAPTPIGGRIVIALLLVAALAHLAVARERIGPRVVPPMAIAIGIALASALASVVIPDNPPDSPLALPLGATTRHAIERVLNLLALVLVCGVTVRAALTEPFAAMATGAWTYDAVPLPTVMVDAGGIVRQVNEAACRAAGLPAEACVGANCHELFHPRGIAAADCPVCRHIARGEAETGLILQCPAGGRWTEFMLSPIELPTGWRGLVQISRDVTDSQAAAAALRASEAKYRSVIAETPEGYWQVDAGNRIVEVNDALCRMLGYDRAEMIGRDPIDFADDRGKEILTAQRALMPTKDHRLYEATMRTKGGGTVDAMLRGTTMRDGQGQVVGAFAFITDLAEVRKAEAAAHRLGRILEASQNEIYVFRTDNFRFVQASRGAQRNLRRGLDELAAMAPWDIMPNCDETRFRAIVAPLLQGETESVSLVAAHGRPDGTSYPVDCHMQLSSLERPPVILAVAQDITDRRRAEDALRRSEASLANAQRMARMGSFEIDLTTGRQFWSENLYRLYGIERGPSGPDNAGAWNTTLPEERDRLLDDYRQIVRAPAPFRIERQARLPDGQLRQLVVQGEPALDAAGQPVRIDGTVVDVTEMREREDALRRARDFIRGIFDTAPVMILALDSDGRILHANRFAADRLRPRVDELKGKSFASLVGFELARTKVAAVVAGRAGLPEPFESRFAFRTFEWHVNPLRGTDFDTDTEGALIVGLDITERRAAEAERRKLSRAVEQSPAAVLITDTKGRIEYVNRKFIELTGYSPEEALGQKPSLLKSGQTSESEYQRLWRTINTGQDWQGQFRNRKKDGTLYWAAIRISPLRDRDGRVTNFIGMQEDVTEARESAEIRARLESELRQAQKMEALGAMAGGVAHDFNNVLGAIMGFAYNAIEELPADSPARADVADIIASAERGAELVRHILLFSRKSPVERRRIALAATVRESLRMIRATLPASVAIHDRIDAAAGGVNADPTQLHQVMMNLCVNAAQALDGRPGRIDVMLRRVDDDIDRNGRNAGLPPGPYLELQVRDDGPGMTPDVARRIFEPFFTTKPVGKGTGMGLAAVHGIVADHSGVVFVDTAPGAGAAFTIRLPAAPGADIVNGADDAGPLTTAGERILFVDDEPPICRATADALRRLGYRPTTFTGGREALAALQADPGAFDLVVSDLSMPEMTGEMLAAEIARLRPDLPVVVCTGHIGALTAERTQALGIRAVLTKPLSPRSLGETIRAVLEEDRSRQRKEQV